MIPVGQPPLDGNEKKYVDECISTGWISSEGLFVAKIGKRLAARVGCVRGETVDMVLF